MKPKQTIISIDTLLLTIVITNTINSYYKSYNCRKKASQNIIESTNIESTESKENNVTITPTEFQWLKKLTSTSFKNDKYSYEINN